MINYALTTKERVKARIEMTASALDDVIETWIATATDFIEHSCGGRRFKETTYTNEVYDGSGLYSNPTKNNFLILRNTPIATVSKIEYKTGLNSNPSWVEYSVNDYDVMPNGAIRISLPEGYQNVRVTYTAGYKIDFANQYNTANHTLPFDLSNLAEKMVIKLLKKRESEGKSQETLRDSTINWGSFIDSEDQVVINTYKRIYIA